MHQPKWVGALSLETLVLCLGLPKLVLGLAAALAQLDLGTTDMWYRDLYRFVQPVVSGAIGATLLLQGSSAARALGAALLATATPWADQPLEGLAAGSSALGRVASLLTVQLDALAPLFLVRLAGSFPTVVEHPREPFLRHAALMVTGGIALWLIGTDLALSLGSGPVTRYPLVQAWSIKGNPYWILEYSGILVSLPLLVWRGARAHPREARRVKFFLAGLFLSVAPTIVWQVVLGFVPSAEEYVPFWVVAWPQYLGTLATPLLTAYAVAIDGTLDVRSSLRADRGYWLARAGWVVVLAAPLVAAALWLYRYRQLPVGELLTSPPGIGIALWLAVSVVLLRMSRRITEGIRRSFGRVSYDPVRQLSELGTTFGNVGSTEELLDRVHHEVAQTLDPERQHCLVFQGETLAPLASEAPALLPSPQLLAALGAQHVVSVPTTGHSALLSAHDQEWARRAGVRVMVPVAVAGESWGVLAFAQRRNMAEYTPSDLQYLQGVAGFAGMTLALLHASRQEAPEGSPAFECQQCGSVTGLNDDDCLACGGVLDPCRLPEVVNRRYRLVRRVGRGRQGVVYEACDTDLQRGVALKTLQVVDSDAADRLIREVRAAAAFKHPGLLAVHGLEFVGSRPVVVMELLRSGTLATAIAAGERLDAMPLHEMARRLFDALHTLHAAHLVHGDIKPENIGRDERGGATLLDFGLASGIGREEEGGDAEEAAGGTLAYLPPERRHASRRLPADDVWGLGCTLLEAGVGERLSLSTIARDPQALDQALAVVPLPVASTLRRVLAADPAARLSSARECLDDLSRSHDTFPADTAAGGAMQPGPGR